ncbi:MAG: hypothetical protein P1U54_00660 [Immundisolibacteraceae bacterium]|nr:hypothetical protein [Immundisolibacteraceae bacterium]
MILGDSQLDSRNGGDEKIDRLAGWLRADAGLDYGVGFSDLKVA